MNKQTQFDLACENGDLKTAKTLIDDPDVDPSDRDNHPTRLAALGGYKDIVELLMQDSRVDPSDAVNLAVIWATERGHKEVVELLLTDKRVMDKIEVALALEGREKFDDYELLKTCVDEHKRELKRQEKERRVQEAIEEMSADCELYF